jgi:hypothetical protein
MSYRLRKKSLSREVRVAREELEGTLKELLTVNDSGAEYRSARGPQAS